MSEIINIDDFFKPTSKEVARDIIGMEIKRRGNVYVVSATKPYLGDSVQVRNKRRLPYGGIMMFNIRGYSHFCISTGTSREQDYFLISMLLQENKEIKSAGKVSEALGLDLSYDGKRFCGYFSLSGETQPSSFTKSDKDASSTLTQ